MTYLGMQILIEGLASPPSAHPRQLDQPLCAPVNAYVMQDEARHVAFGRLALREYYPQLTDAGAGRARGVRGRGLLPHARPLRSEGGLGDLGPAGQGLASRRWTSRTHEAVPAASLHPDRPHRGRTSGSGATGCGGPTRTWASWSSRTRTPRHPRERQTACEEFDASSSSGSSSGRRPRSGQVEEEEVGGLEGHDLERLLSAHRGAVARAKRGAVHLHAAGHHLQARVPPGGPGRASPARPARAATRRGPRPGGSSLRVPAVARGDET